MARPSQGAAARGSWEKCRAAPFLAWGAVSLGSHAAAPARAGHHRRPLRVGKARAHRGSSRASREAYGCVDSPAPVFVGSNRLVHMESRGLPAHWARGKSRARRRQRCVNNMACGAQPCLDFRMRARVCVCVFGLRPGGHLSCVCGAISAACGQGRCMKASGRPPTRRRMRMSASTPSRATLLRGWSAARPAAHYSPLPRFRREVEHDEPRTRISRARCLATQARAIQRRRRSRPPR